MRPIPFRSLFVFIFAITNLVARRSHAQEEWPAIFNPFRVETIHIQIDPAKWSAINRDTNFYDPALNIREPCLLWMEGPNPPNSAATALTVQIRRKSDPALPDEGNPQKVSLKIDVNEYVEGQSIRGLKKISLENGSGNGVLKEGFAMNLHRLAAEAGFYPMQGFYASWVRLIVNGEYVGLYVSPEQRDVTYLKNRGMYRQGASWLYEVNGGLSLDTSVATTDSPTHNHLNYLPFRSPNPPPANFESDTQAWVELRSMLTMAAIEAWMANTDGLFTKSAANQGKNSFCVDWLPSTQRSRLYLPWDLDGGFSNTSWDIFSGGSGSANARQYQRQFLDHYWFGDVYRQLFTELLDGPMSTTALNGWLDQLEPILGPALAEDPNADAGGFANLRSFISARNTNARTQLGSIIKPPVLSENGGEFVAGLPLEITHANTTGTTTIYYTLDGTDPRAAGGAPSASATAHAGPITLNQPTQITARARNVNGSTTRWSNARSATFNIADSLTALRINEVMYHPKGAAAFEDEDEFEFIELKNTGSVPLRLDGCRMEGVDFDFAAGSVVPAGGFLVLAANPSAFATRYPSVAIHGVYFRNLSNSGERLGVVNSEGTTIDEVEYDSNPPWPLGADGFGYSLTRHAAGEDATSWRASTLVHGSPGTDDPAPAHGIGLAINEVLAKSNTPLEDAIELFNPTAAAIDISGWWLSDSYEPADPARASLKKYRIPAGTMVPPGGYHVFYEINFNPAAATADAVVPFGLGQGGDAVYLSSADAAGNLTGQIVGQRFGASEDAVSLGRVVTSSGVDFTGLATHTFGVGNPSSKAAFRAGAGQLNAGPRVGPVVINEIHYAPIAADAEFVELRNVTGGAVSLEDWILEGVGGFTFPAGASVAEGGLVLVVDTTATTVSDYRLTHGVPPSVPVFGAAFDLGDDGESIELKKPNPASSNPPLLVDRARYNDKAPWPVAADGGGASLERISASAYGNEPLNWHSTVVGGTPGFISSSASSLLIPRGGGWNFHAKSRDLGTGWRASNYRDGAWIDGPAPLGAGLPGLATLLPFATPKPLTTYLRKDFAVPIPATHIGTLTLMTNYNDGFVAYLNGTEVARRSLSAGVVSFDTAASTHPAGGFELIDLSPHKSLLRQGKNTLAIELHLSATNDSDAWWDADLTCTLASVPTDTDVDEMPDAWEVAHLLDPTNAADASGDWDGDGQRNVDEYVSGTNPNDAGSVFRIESIERFSGGCRVTLPTVPGKVYRLEYSPDLREWFPAAGDVVATGASLQIVDAAAVGESRRFYRARIPGGL